MIDGFKTLGHAQIEIAQDRALEHRFAEICLGEVRPGGPCVVAMGIDITARKQAEVRLATIVKSSEDAIIGKTLDGIYHQWNPGAEKLFGYTADEAIGSPMLLLFPVGREEEEKEIIMSVRRGERVEHFETVRVRKDGSQVDVSVGISPIWSDGIVTLRDPLADGMLNECLATRTVVIGSRKRSFRIVFGSTFVLG